MKRYPMLILGIAVFLQVLAGPAAAQFLSFSGDVNHDSQLTALDAVLLANLLAGNLVPDNDFSAGDPYLYDPMVGLLRFVPAGTFTRVGWTGIPARITILLLFII